MPVSRTAKRSQHVVAGRIRRQATRITTSPWSVNLIALLDQVDQHLPQPAGSPMTAARRADRRRPAPALVAWRRWRASRPCLRAVAQVEVDGVQLQLAGLDLGEVQDVVDDRQQRLGRRLGHFAHSRCCSASSGVSSSRSVMPMTPFIGVRISWLMLARNSLLAWLAASAASFCRCSSSDRLALGNLFDRAFVIQQVAVFVANGPSVFGDPDRLAVLAMISDSKFFTVSCTCMIRTKSLRRSESTYN